MCGWPRDARAFYVKRTKQHDVCTVDEQTTKITVASLANPTEARFATSGVLPRHSPSQAANSRSLRNTFASATVAAIAVAMIGPIRGDGGQTLADGIVLVPSKNLHLQRSNPRL